INKYLKESFFDVIGKNRSESAHTNFLKWFFSQKEWNERAIKNFLKLLCVKTEGNDIFDSKIDDIRNIDWDNCKISLIGEDPIQLDYPCVCSVKDHKQTVRVDFVMSLEVETGEISHKLKIVLENKIYHQETNNQTWKYYVYFSNNDCDCPQTGSNKSSIKAYKIRKYRYKCNGEIQFFVLLSPLMKLGSTSTMGICDKYIRVLYQELYDDVLKPVLHSLPEDIDCMKRIYLDEYCKNLISPVLNNKGNFNGNMAFDNEDIEMLKAFWQDNLALIKIAAEVASESADNEAEKEDVSSVLKAMDTKSNRKLYVFSYKGEDKIPTNQMHLLSDLIKDYMGRNPEVTPSDIIGLFPESPKNNEKNKIFDDEGKTGYDEIVVNNNKYRVSNQKVRYEKEYQIIEEVFKKLGYDIKRIE
ncbi:MAG: PD-(D/E)XK nuclease family protein, partial [Muribaculaceae bacterium]|nr:PD-(D/E)XK nuclease family protein [Muribaculaceae bacterium]